jgi:hypothetical protein
MDNFDLGPSASYRMSKSSSAQTKFDPTERKNIFSGAEEHLKPTLTPNQAGRVVTV